MMPAARRHVEAIARSKHDLLTFVLRKKWEALQVGRNNIDGAQIALRDDASTAAIRRVNRV